MRVNCVNVNHNFFLSLFLSHIRTHTYTYTHTHTHITHHTHIIHTTQLLLSTTTMLTQSRGAKNLTETQLNSRSAIRKQLFDAIESISNNTFTNEDTLLLEVQLVQQVCDTPDEMDETFRRRCVCFVCVCSYMYVCVCL